MALMFPDGSYTETVWPTSSPGSESSSGSSSGSTSTSSSIPAGRVLLWAVLLFAVWKAWSS